MEIIAIFSERDSSLLKQTRDLLGKYTVYFVSSREELDDIADHITISLFILDISSHRVKWVSDVIGKFDEGSVIIIFAEESDIPSANDLPPSVYGLVNRKEIEEELPPLVEHALEKQRLCHELKLLRHRKTGAGSSGSAYQSLVGDTGSGVEYARESTLMHFAKILSAGFDLKGILAHFMNAVMEIARVSRMSVMLKEGDEFCIRSHRGLDPFVTKHLRLKSDSTLISRLREKGGIQELPSLPDTADLASIRHDMELLRCSFSLPLIHNGRLIGIFNVGSKITAEPFDRHEIEMIFMLCDYLADAVADCDLYHRICEEERFTKNILASMHSAMIVINGDGKITVFNKKAAKILHCDVSDMVGSDVHSLPSPLGDILNETMVTGSSYQRFETQLASSGKLIGITSYKLCEGGGAPRGAGIVFADLSDSIRVDEEQRRSERMLVIHDLMSKIAHEVRNPLTSIQTYAQLIDEKYGDDDELKQFYQSSVIHSIHRLNDFIDRIVTFSMSHDYHLRPEDVNMLLDEAVLYISKHMQPGYRVFRENRSDNVFIKADRPLLIKAIYYLIMTIADMSDEGTVIRLFSHIVNEPPRVEIHVLYGGREIPEKERVRFLGPMSDEEIIFSDLAIPISRRIIEKHEGSLDIRTEKNGNTFIITLPSLEANSATISVKEGEPDG